ncbi:MAG TPA: sulfite reductase subunit alpha [Tepidisphaeraceae bacterium]|jgi:sulfite reductase (NADPH) flavoprotein alpha-component|nr:sulfite reductase subunit alpha [Tepidisphaeraceae bacterium]
MSTLSLPLVPVLPETAPFTPAQRAWLNGFFAGMFAGRSTTTSPSTAVAPTPAEETFPWHDPALSMARRLALAEDRPLERKLMAAMAQLDCGACGYLCKTYAEAVAGGEEKDLTKCAPGGKETARKLKELVGVNGNTQPLPASPAKSAAKSGHDRRNPLTTRLLKCAPLVQPGSAKDTRLVVFDLKGSPLPYKAGDSLGVFPENCPDAVQWILDAIDATGAEQVSAPGGSRLSFHEALLTCYDLKKCRPTLIELLAESATNPTHAAALRAMLADDGPGIPEGYELIDLLLEFPSARPSIERLVAALSPLNPRLYSIASSPLLHPHEVHLTVGVVRYLNRRGRQCKGTASTFLAERARIGGNVRIFLHESKFRLPDDDNAPVIMVGPGTGIAPFRAFLQERCARGAKGNNWLFFGEQRRQFDFLFEQELLDYQGRGLLTRLDTAFSRDQENKLYVQHRMLENSRELWAWLEGGAHFYVCGDAKRMAKDVHAALKQIAMQEGGLSDDAASAFLTDLTKSKRYQRDVY